MKSSRLRSRLARLHRWLSLGMLGLWLLQAVTGMVCVFHWELDDDTIAAVDRPLNLAAIGRELAVLAPPGSGRLVSEMWTSAGGHGRWDVTVTGHPGETVRIDGAGHVLRVRREGELWRDGGLLDTIDNFHQTLVAGDAGGWIIGVSGVLLLSNLVLGFSIAWARRGQWRRTLAPPSLVSGKGRNRPALLFGWHRALGLWLVLPAMVLVSAGILRAFSDGFEGLIGASAPVAPITGPGSAMIALPTAVEIAWARQPQARLAGVIFPDSTHAIWQIRLDEPGEWSRAYGKSRIFVDGRSGRVIGEYDAPRATLAHRIADDVLPVHTGEALGLAGRIGVLLLGAWLMTMIVLGACLWWVRRRPRPQRKEMP